DIENSIHYAHVDFVDDDTLASAPTDTDLPSSCGHDNAHGTTNYSIYREARRNNLDLNGLDGLASGGTGNGGDTASASLIIYYNTQDAGLNQLDDGSSDSSCARLVEHLH
uniref:Peptidase_S8 domain-containing protein n=1 Tax=Macrostomum lignano TaxID=282301 RepID=A0A1I8F7R4_9PLAT